MFAWDWPQPYLCLLETSQGWTGDRLIHRIFSKLQVCKEDGFSVSELMKKTQQNGIDFPSHWHRQENISSVQAACSGLMPRSSWGPHSFPVVSAQGRSRFTVSVHLQYLCCERGHSVTGWIRKRKCVIFSECCGYLDLIELKRKS